MVVATQYQDHETIEESEVEENRTIQNLSKDWDKCIEAGLTTLNGHTQHIPHLPPRTLPRQPIPLTDQRTPSTYSDRRKDEYKLDESSDSRLHYNKVQYRAKWKGYSPEHDKGSYPADNFNNEEHTIQQFHQRYPGKPGMDTRHHQQIRPPYLPPS